jgi:hypothetical protein
MSLKRLLNSVLLVVMVSTVYGQSRPSNNLPGTSNPPGAESRPKNARPDLRELIPAKSDSSVMPNATSKEITKNHKRWMELFLKDEENSTQAPGQPKRPSKELMDLLGGVGDGGAEPRAFEVINYGNKILGMLYPSLSAQLQINRFQLAARLEYLMISLDTKRPLVRMSETNDLDCFKEIKKGCTRTDASVDIAGKWWEDQTTPESVKCFTAVVELLRPLEIFKIYEVSAQLCSSILPSTTSHANPAQPESPSADTAALLAANAPKPVVVSCTCSFVEQGTEPYETSRSEYNFLFGSRVVREKAERRFDVYTIEMVTRDAKGFGQIKFGRYTSKSDCDLHLKYDMPACPKDR